MCPQNADNFFQDEKSASRRKLGVRSAYVLQTFVLRNIFKKLFPNSGSKNFCQASVVATLNPKNAEDITYNQQPSAANLNSSLAAS